MSTAWVPAFAADEVAAVGPGCSVRPPSAIGIVHGSAAVGVERVVEAIRRSCATGSTRTFDELGVVELKGEREDASCSKGADQED